MLRECKPILFIEMMCAPLNKSILSLLDSLGYVSAWVIQALLRDQILFSLPPESRKWIYYAGTNIISVPRENADILNNLVSQKILHVIPGIKEGLNYSVADMGIYISEINGDYSFLCTQGWVSNCAALPEDLVNLWKDLKDPETGLGYP